MKKIKLLLSIIAMPFVMLAQTNTTKPVQKDLSKIERDIYRISITQPMFPYDQEPIVISGLYEHRIKNVFSFVGKVAIGAEVKKFGTASKPYQTSFHLYSAVEGRYYFTLKRRLKKEKSVLNLSCPYVSLEQNIITNPVALINQTRKEALKGSAGTFLNIGYQKQLGKLYLATFFGVRLGGTSFSKFDYSSLSSIHGGLMVGYVFD